MESDEVNDRILKTEQVVELRRIYKLSASKSCIAAARYRYFSPASRQSAGEKYRVPMGLPFNEIPDFVLTCPPLEEHKIRIDIQLIKDEKQ